MWELPDVCFTCVSVSFSLYLTVVCAWLTVQWNDTHVAVDWESFDEDSDKQVEQDVVAERHQRDEVERWPLRRHRHAVVQDLLPVFLRQNLTPAHAPIMSNTCLGLTASDLHFWQQEPCCRKETARYRVFLPTPNYSSLRLLFASGSELR